MPIVNMPTMGEIHVSWGQLNSDEFQQLLEEAARQRGSEAARQRGSETVREHNSLVSQAVPLRQPVDGPWRVLCP